MGKFDSKRVLHIGNDIWSKQNITYLKDNGAYLIIADKCPKEENRYRNCAVDEVIELDIDNTDKVIEYCKANKIDAVVTNWAEESYEQARIINEGIGNAFCHTEKQWQIFMKKQNFRKLCVEYGIDAPKTYYAGKFTDITEEIKNSISYPTIVKPVDNCGATGISVVFNKSKLDKAIKRAGENSKSCTIIIEEYVVGKEVALTYVIQDGIYKLTATADKYVYKDKNNLTAMADLYMYPCADHDYYVNTVNDKVIAMLKSQGLNNCSIFFQAIEREGKFYFFEAGLRFEGTRTFLKTSYITGQNASHLFYDYILKTKTDYDITKDDPKLNGQILAMFIVHLKDGKIKYIRGRNKIKANNKITQRYYVQTVGNVISGDPIGKAFASFCMDGSDRNELVKQIRFIKKTLKVRGYFYRNMIVNSFDENVLIENK